MLFRNQKDHITYIKNDNSLWLNAHTLGRRYGWDARIVTGDNYPIVTKQRLTKVKAISFLKKYMREN